jgi:hypothetical protein
MNVAVFPAVAVWLDGWVVMVGAEVPEFTVTVAALVATSAVTLFVKRARYWYPLAVVVRGAVV